MSGKSSVSRKPSVSSKLSVSVLGFGTVVLEAECLERRVCLGSRVCLGNRRVCLTESCNWSQVAGFGFRVPGLGSRVPGSGFRGSSPGFWVPGLGFGTVVLPAQSANTLASQRFSPTAWWNPAHACRGCSGQGPPPARNPPLPPPPPRRRKEKICAPPRDPQPVKQARLGTDRPALASQRFSPTVWWNPAHACRNV